MSENFSSWTSKRPGSPAAQGVMPSSSAAAGSSRLRRRLRRTRRRCFRTCQFFLADFAAERALLESVAELAAGIACVVTYNGKTFDLPLIETRFVLQRMTTPFADMAHVDLLHPARRMWRDEDVECRLTYLEQTLCGHAREGDVPGLRDSVAVLPLRSQRRCAATRSSAGAQSARHHLARHADGTRGAVAG